MAEVVVNVEALHLVHGYGFDVVPFLDDASHRIFATRSPKRPNPIGITIFRTASIDGNTVTVIDVDAVDGSPILDIKPYVPVPSAVELHRLPLALALAARA